MYVKMEIFLTLSDFSYLFEVEVWLLIYPKDGILCAMKGFLGGHVSKRNSITVNVTILCSTRHGTVTKTT